MRCVFDSAPGHWQNRRGCGGREPHPPASFAAAQPMLGALPRHFGWFLRFFVAGPRKRSRSPPEKCWNYEALPNVINLRCGDAGQNLGIARMTPAIKARENRLLDAERLTGGAEELSLVWFVKQSTQGAQRYGN